MKALDTLIIKPTTSHGHYHAGILVGMEEYSITTTNSTAYDCINNEDYDLNPDGHYENQAEAKAELLEQIISAHPLELDSDGNVSLKFDFSLIKCVEVEDIDHRDAPEYCDAHITYAEYDGREMTDLELEHLNEDSDFVYEAIMEAIY